MKTFVRVKELCKTRGISVVELEERVGFGKNSIYSWKKNKPSAEKLEKVADFFNVSTDYLLGRTNIKTIPDDNFETLAAHHVGDDWTEEELEEIERFKEFVRSKRKEHPIKGE